MILEGNSEYQLVRDGFEIHKTAICETRVFSLLSQIDAFIGTESHSTSPQTKPIHAIRNLQLHLPCILELANSETLLSLIEPHLGTGATPVRSIYFNKLPGSNWLVPWHQDLSIAVKNKLDVPGYGPWTIKENIIHTQPPAAILEKMLTIRIHLDDCNSKNGALRVLPGSQLMGKLTSQQIADYGKKSAEVIVEIPRGGAMLMKPLLLHASSPAENPANRRVIHIEYAAFSLPNGLEWASR